MINTFMEGCCIMGKKLVKGLQGVVVAESSICHIDGEKGKLVYRGYDIQDLAKYSSFEEVVFLLWEGKIPTKKELAKFKKNVNSNMHIPLEVKKFISSLPKKELPISCLRSIVSLLSAYDKEAEDMSMEANKRKALRIMAKMPIIVAAIQRVKDGKKILNPKNGSSFAANFLYMLNGKLPSKEEEKVMDVALILHAEHGFNASTFASRVTVATLSDIYSGMVSAIGTLKGPLHGGANVKAIESMHKLANNLNVKDVCVGTCLDEVDKHVQGLLREHIKIMGIGHRVYKVKDPRARILENYAQNVSKKYIKYFQMAKEIEKVMAQEKNLYPNVDFFSGIVYENLGIKPGLYVCIFALARTAGWTAHMLEQYKDNRLIRPKSTYIGALSRRYVKK